jgi:hypothetical protein
MKWGDRSYAPPEGPPRRTTHRDCGGLVSERLRGERCHQHVDFSDIEVLPGPASRA